MNTLIPMMNKLRTALNTKGRKITVNHKEFIGKDNKPRRHYSVCEAEWDEEAEKYKYNELYSSSSQIRIVLFLRDLWYIEIGRELPTDIKMWNNVRANLNLKSGE